MTKNPPSQRMILFALWLLIFSGASQIMIIAPIMPVIGEQLNMPESLQGLLVTSYAVMVSLFAIIIGPISDRVGRRKVLLLGTLSMAIALFMHGLAINYIQLLVFRSLAGIAGGILSGSVVSYIGDSFPPERRGWANGWVMSGAATGQIVGIPLGTLMAEYFGFRVPFIMFGVTMAATYFLIRHYVPQPTVKFAGQPVTLRNAFQKYAIIVKNKERFFAIIAFFMMFVSVGLFVVYFPTWMKADFGITGIFIASLFLIGGIGNAFMGPQMGKLSDKIGRKKLIMISAFGTSLLITSTTFIIFTPWVAYPLFFSIMLLVAMRVSPFQALLSEMVDDDRRGSLMSLTAALGQGGLGIGGAIAGLAYTGYGYTSNTILAAIAIFITGVLIWRFVPESKYFREKLTAIQKPAVSLDVIKNSTPHLASVKSV